MHTHIHTDHLGVLLKFRFCLRRPGLGPEILRFLGDSNAVGIHSKVLASFCLSTTVSLLPLFC